MGSCFLGDEECSQPSNAEPVRPIFGRIAGFYLPCLDCAFSFPGESVFILEEGMSGRTDKTQSAVDVLIKRSRELGRIPQKADLSEKELCFVKGVLGPFPRALEKAGLKERKKPVKKKR